MIFKNFQTYKQKIVYAMQVLKNGFRNTWYQYEKKKISYFHFWTVLSIFAKSDRNSMNRQLHFVQEFQNIKQSEK